MKGCPHLLLGEHPDKDLAAADRHIVRYLGAALWLQPHIPLPRVHPLNSGLY